MDPTLKKKIKQSRDELADLEYDLTHRPSFMSKGKAAKLGDVTVGTGENRRFEKWDEVEDYLLADESPGDYPGWAVKDPDYEDLDEYPEVKSGRAVWRLDWCGGPVNTAL